jgi:hypothetical protein
MISRILARPRKSFAVAPLAGILLAAFTASSHAALYEFTVTGEVTFSVMPNVMVGDPFTIHYTADDRDLDTNPNLGTYAVGHAVAVFPNATLSDQGSQASFGVALGGTSDKAGYFSFLFNQRWLIDFNFPPGTLGSDVLPLSLPLPSATSTQFVVYDFVALVVGTLNSYESAPIPEPSAIWTVPLMLRLRLPRTARTGPSRQRWRTLWRRLPPR